jgi:hypothetical protein
MMGMRAVDNEPYLFSLVLFVFVLGTLFPPLLYLQKGGVDKIPSKATIRCT